MNYRDAFIIRTKIKWFPEGIPKLFTGTMVVNALVFNSLINNDIPCRVHNMSLPWTTSFFGLTNGNLGLATIDITWNGAEYWINHIVTKHLPSSTGPLHDYAAIGVIGNARAAI